MYKRQGDECSTKFGGYFGNFSTENCENGQIMEKKIIQITSGKGPIECEFFVGETFNLMKKEMEQLNINFKILEMIAVSYTHLDVYKRQGKQDLIYFSQHAVQKKQEDQKIEIRNYLNQSIKLSDQSNDCLLYTSRCV